MSNCTSTRRRCSRRGSRERSRWTTSWRHSRRSATRHPRIRPVLSHHARVADEAGLVPAGVRLAELVLVEGADAEQQLELVAQVGAHHLRAVGGDREPDARLDEARGRCRGPRPRRGAPSSAGSRSGRSRARSRARAAPPSAPARAAARIPWPMRSGRSASTTSAISSTPWSPPSSPTWIVTPRPAARASSTSGASCRVAVALAAGPRAGDVDPDDPARARSGSPSRR